MCARARSLRASGRRPTNARRAPRPARQRRRVRSPSERGERPWPVSHDEVRDDEHATQPTLDEVAAPDVVELRRGYAAPRDDRAPRESRGRQPAPRTFMRISDLRNLPRRTADPAADSLDSQDDRPTVPAPARSNSDRRLQINDAPARSGNPPRPHVSRSPQSASISDPS